MKVLRSVSRRGFTVGTAGWFTVLKPNTWFPATRLPRSSSAFGPRTHESMSGATPAPWVPMERISDRPNGMRLGTAIFGAVAITSVMLWWIMHP